MLGSLNHGIQLKGTHFSFGLFLQSLSLHFFGLSSLCHLHSPCHYPQTPFTAKYRRSRFCIVINILTHLNDFTKAAIPNVMNISRRDKARQPPFITRFLNHAFCFRVAPRSGRLLQSPCDRSLWPQPLTDLNPI